MTHLNARFFRFLVLAPTALLLCSISAAAQDSTALYKMKCVGCHAPDGSGSDVGKKLGSHDFHSPDVVKMTDDELTTVITKGKNKMPAYEKTLKPEDIKGLVAYVRDLEQKK